jgi:periplasmic protein CpxP/Spy
MRRRIITLATTLGLALASLVYLQAEQPAKHEHAGPHHVMMGNPLEHLSKDLNLTDDQKAKVQPIIDQVKPQMKAIHEEAMQKMHALLESTGAQIRPLLTPEQQVKLDAMKKAHEDMRKAHEEMENAKKM